MKLKKILSVLILSGLVSISCSTSNANPIRTPEGNFPRVQWAVVESTPGNLGKIGEIGARVLASTAAKESGTYALYGVIEKDNPDLMRLLEIYESDEAYRIHSTSAAFQTYRAERFPFLKGLKLLPVNGIVLEQKIDGVGKFVTTHRYEIKASEVANFQEIISTEYLRAVKENPAVLGMFVTAEQANPNIFHTMEIFKDETAQKNYNNSTAYKNFLRSTKSMIQAEKVIEYLPANIVLTKKGVVNQ
ncbi:MAG: hypothetical protein IJT73_07595 [Selenomonadaceae bacterium]|nr:hypothetical protein [Selenomonadaceae bacterium]